MSTKPESALILSIHRHLPDKLYRMKNHNQFISGPADVWYSGCEGDIWIEYKFETLPKRSDTTIQPNCSRLQLDWLRDRHKEGRNVAVILGCREGGVIYQNLEWETFMTKDEFVKRIQTRAQLAQWIVDQTGGPV